MRHVAAPAFWLFLAAPAQASICMDHNTLSGYLADRFKEEPTAAGLVERRHLMEVFVSPAGTWTIVMTSTQGVACIVAAGDNYEAVPPKVPGKPT